MAKSDHWDCYINKIIHQTQVIDTQELGQLEVITIQLEPQLGDPPKTPRPRPPPPPPMADPQ